MDITEKCTACNTREIYIKKRKLCKNCYQNFRNAGFLATVDDPSESFKSIKTYKTVELHENRGELDFIKNYFTHFNWIAQPASFRISDNETYRPDFYDGERNVFIEVAGTRQAYHYNKTKYKTFTERFPKLILEVRKTDGSLLDTDGELIDWTVSL